MLAECLHTEGIVMPTLTIRSLPEPTHAALKSLAEKRQLSVERLVRGILTEAVTESAGPAGGSGLAEVSAAYAPPSLKLATGPVAGLWGALKGTVHVPEGTNLTAPLDEAWLAEG
jgi:plasmid stability protein